VDMVFPVADGLKTFPVGYGDPKALAGRFCTEETWLLTRQVNHFLCHFRVAGRSIATDGGKNHREIRWLGGLGDHGNVPPFEAIKKATTKVAFFITSAMIVPLICRLFS